MSFYFLMCSERSGSNLITKMFDSHPDVCGPSTSHVGDILIPNLYSYTSDDLLELRDDAFNILEFKNAIWRKRFYKEELGFIIDKHGKNKIFEYIYNEERIANNKQHIFIKENRIYEYSHFIAKEFPSAKYLYLVRDPRAMAASWKFGYAMRGGVYRAINTWKEDQIGFLRMNSWLIDPAPIIRFEDLVDRPEDVLKNACNQLGLQYSQKMLDYHHDEATKKNAESAKDWQNISQPVIKSKAYDFKNKLSIDEIRYVEYLCRSEMEFFGYTPLYEILSDKEFLLIKNNLKSSDNKDKVQYKEVSRGERERRAKQFELSAKIFSRYSKINK